MPERDLGVVYSQRGMCQHDSALGDIWRRPCRSEAHLTAATSPITPAVLSAQLSYTIKMNVVRDVTSHPWHCGLCSENVSLITQCFELDCRMVTRVYQLWGKQKPDTNLLFMVLIPGVKSHYPKIKITPIGNSTIYLLLNRYWSSLSHQPRLRIECDKHMYTWSLEESFLIITLRNTSRVSRHDLAKVQCHVKTPNERMSHSYL